ncbi:linker for activation of T-cells family member 2 isoform X2 [Nomascus leucogenys]|uniref:linker for activation of T-cells family member 2 isoform X2 n=1 Tax=Nomascus leucogenys TaxID=61853 RepID=UPI00122DAC37|nr:linker for activation of T-cells family member 2 isoform X2 [Nomascus leucogenys]
MSSGTELLWPGAALLVLLGVAASLCVRCSRPGAKRSEKIYQQRSLREDQQSFTGSRTYSLVGQAWPGPLADMAPTRKDKLLQFSPSLEGEWHRAGTGLAKLGLRQAKTPCDRCRVVGAAGPDPASSRYQNFSKGSRHGSEKAYIDPIAMEHYNWGRFSKLLEGERRRTKLVAGEEVVWELEAEATPPGRRRGWAWVRVNWQSQMGGQKEAGAAGGGQGGIGGGRVGAGELWPQGVGGRSGPQGRELEGWLGEVRGGQVLVNED